MLAKLLIEYMELSQEEFIFPSVRTIGIGGTIVTSFLKNELIKLFPETFLMVVYAMTEVGCISINLPGSSSDGVGKIASNVQVKIIDLNGISLGTLEVGEICVKTDFPLLGYFGNTLENISVTDKWLHTGDLGYFDVDLNLNVVGRKANLIHYDGKMVR